MQRHCNGAGKGVKKEAGKAEANEVDMAIRGMTFCAVLAACTLAMPAVAQERTPSEPVVAGETSELVVAQQLEPRRVEPFVGSDAPTWMAPVPVARPAGAILRTEPRRETVRMRVRVAPPRPVDVVVSTPPARVRSIYLTIGHGFF